jgi:uncharacterized protein YigA (DUF484 family)
MAALTATEGNRQLSRVLAKILGLSSDVSNEEIIVEICTAVIHAKDKLLAEERLQAVVDAVVRAHRQKFATDGALLEVLESAPSQASNAFLKFPINSNHPN